MDTEYIKKVIEDNYWINISSIEKVKNTFKVDTDYGGYCIKIIKYEFSHFYFILSAIKHLQNHGFETIPEILLTKSGNEFIKLGNNYAYLTKWIPSRVSNYDNPIELANISSKLGELHKCSKYFQLTNNMAPRIGWYSWINTFQTRCDEILDFRTRIHQKAYKSDFDKIFLDNINEEIARGRESIKGLKENNYFKIMDRQVMKAGFCHHDFAHHNILVDETGKLNIIDFDYCILDSYLHDLSSLLIRSMKYGKWDSNKANLILNNYCKINNVYEDELVLIKYFIKFPQAFWQIGLQYYWEQQPWGEDFFINKINKYLEDRQERDEFLEQYFR